MLAHPPGTGKGYGTTQGLLQHQQAHPEANPIVWTALRKEQLHDQQGLDLTPLHGRNGANCGKLAEAQTLAAKGYPVRAALCERRCQFVNSCAYLRQFHEPGDVFAPLPLLQATGWWADAGVVVLDEFDPARLLHLVVLRPADLAAMTRASDDGNAHALLRWLGGVVGATLDHCLTGVTLLAALDAAAARDGQCFRTTLQAALDALPPAEEQAYLRDLPLGATLADYQQLPPGYLPLLLNQLAREDRRREAGQPFTSRLEAREGALHLLLRHEHVIAQLARPEQPKILLDATANAALLRALFPAAPLHLVQPTLRFPNRVVQVVRSDWAKSTLNSDRRIAWYDAVSRYIRPDRPTLVVCTLDCEAGLREALGERGHRDVVVGHYGGLRGSNAYQGYDVVLAQVYHPSLEALVREGRALFADDPTPLDERVTTEERQLEATDGETWTVSVPTFVDGRLAALLQARREAELLQAALRGRPFDHPDTQITLLFSLPLAGLPPTEILQDLPERSNAARAAAVAAQLIAAGRHLLEVGRGLLSVYDLARAACTSVTTVRVHWRVIATALRLRPLIERRIRPMPRGGVRLYLRAVLLPRGRRVPPADAPPIGANQQGESLAAKMQSEEQVEQATSEATDETTPMIDHAPDQILLSGLIHHQPLAPSRDAPGGGAPPKGTEDG